MAYLTISHEMAEKFPEFKGRDGETIDAAELQDAQANFARNEKAGNKSKGTASDKKEAAGDDGQKPAAGAAGAAPATPAKPAAAPKPAATPKAPAKAAGSKSGNGKK